ncbi:hydroxyisourate hydrolase [Klebsiella sp. BIGb0407]|uniref:hydroxyisourate hydrolase n=1 Tax=Klebsiella sp. BIGb0407 TaxID=2940603 RepID=UPI0021694FCA|nr:hydroxyisourate hydrolase [Klebsiella sp. BIGb0407]MCS3429845.1 5-hydroxyisourate hydrolase [Klebsiella sp. BIGb0407]
MNSLSTHILDISTGKPAAGVEVSLLREGLRLAVATTDNNGRISSLASGELCAGNYQLVAELAAWFARDGRQTLFSRAQIDFILSDGRDEHFHLPFLIAPGGWSTYRGS